MATAFYEKDANPNALEAARPSQYSGAMAARDTPRAKTSASSGYKVIVGLDLESSLRAASEGRRHGRVVAPDEAAKRADWIQILTLTRPGRTLRVADQALPASRQSAGVSHGFSIHFKTIQPPNDVDAS